LQRLCQCVDLLDVELTCLAGLYQLNDVLESYRPVKSVLKGFTDQRVGRCMVPTLTFLLGNTPHKDIIGAMPVERPFYQYVSISQTGNLISRSRVIGKDVVFQVGPDLHDPCIRTSLSF
jgi:hypothetical protein